MTLRSSEETLTQVGRRATDSLIPKGTQTPPEGTDVLNHIHFFRRNPMSQVVYRGVPYDTETRKQNQTQQQPQQYDAQYRGVKFVKEVEKK
jgi:hypothetical protein